MNNFQTIYTKLQDNPAKSTKLIINGNEKTIKAMVRLISKNYLKEDGEYIKILFSDNSFLLAIKNDEEFYFAEDNVKHIEEIPDEDIGRKEIITYRGKEYELVNKNDYQYVLSLLVGSPSEIEGECRFSDYSPKDGTKESLSLGWISETGKRADINLLFIDSDKVVLV